MKKNLVTAILMTIVTAILLGLVYPLAVTGLAQIWRDKANGQILVGKDGTITGSRLIGQPFVGASYFHSRPSAAGSGYAADNSSGSNFGPTNQKLIDRVNADVAALKSDNPATPVPVDLVTASGSGLDPHITPAAAEFQVSRVAKARGISQDALFGLIREHTESRQFGILGEPRVNVLELNLALDAQYPHSAGSSKN